MTCPTAPDLGANVGLNMIEPKKRDPWPLPALIALAVTVLAVVVVLVVVLTGGGHMRDQPRDLCGTLLDGPARC